MTVRSAKRNAEEFVDKVTSIVKAQDDLIYDIESNIKGPNVISPSTATDKHSIVSVKIYNVSKADDAFSVDTWITLGNLVDGIDKWDACSGGSREALIEFHKRFDG